MRLQHVHHLGGAGRVIVKTPQLPVFVTVSSTAEYRSVDIMADRGQYAWAGPAGPGHVSLGIEAGWPTLLTSLKSRLLLRQGSFISGGGSVLTSGSGHGEATHDSVRATGRGAIAAGGNIENIATGKGARVSAPADRKPLPEIGVHITAPENSTFEIRAALSVTVLIGGKEAVLDPLQFLDGPWSAHVYREQIVVNR